MQERDSALQQLQAHNLDAMKILSKRKKVLCKLQRANSSTVTDSEVSLYLPLLREMAAVDMGEPKFLCTGDAGVNNRAFLKKRRKKTDSQKHRHTYIDDNLFESEPGPYQTVLFKSETLLGPTQFHGITEFVLRNC